MDFWQRARVFAEEAAKRSQEISKEAAKKSQELTQGAAKFSQEFVSETAKRSKELAAEASKKADLLKVEAMKRADQIKTLAGEIEIPIQIPPISPLSSSSSSQGSAPAEPPREELERFGVTDDLREFVKGITISTFRDFPMEDEPQISEVPTVSNVRQDLNEWQAKHATLVLSTVKEISKFRYDLCPRHMKERKFWRIYFILVNNYVAQYEKQYMENLKVELGEKQNDGAKESSSAGPTRAAETKVANLQSKKSTAEQDLDVFLLGDLGSSGDEGPDDGEDGFDDDFDKIEGTSGLESDEEGDRMSKQSK